MKRCFLILAICFGVVLPATGFPSSLIELKSGAKFVTSHHWEEGGFIKFYLYGGIVGFKKHQIKRIQATDMSPILQERRSDEKLSAQSSASVEIAPPQPKKTPSPQTEKNKLKKKQAELQKQIAAAMETLKKAQAENDAQRMKAETKKFLGLKGELKTLQDALRKKPD